MKQNDLIVLGLAAVAVYMISKTAKGSSAASVSPSSPLRVASGGGIGAAVSEVFDAAGKAFSNGWRYFTDGTAIDPSGNYYSQGQLVWQNPSNYV